MLVNEVVTVEVSWQDAHVQNKLTLWCKVDPGFSDDEESVLFNNGRVSAIKLFNQEAFGCNLAFNLKRQDCDFVIYFSFNTKVQQLLLAVMLGFVYCRSQGLYDLLIFISISILENGAASNNDICS
jgi:hypothetical protein